MSIYRAYDIRGEYGKDLNEEIAEKIGKAYGTLLGEGTVAVGCDTRLSSPSLKKALISGLINSGMEVWDIGVVPTPVLYFAIYNYQIDGGIQVTGSHNPPNYNGFKLCRGRETLYGEEIQKIGELVKEGNFKKGQGILKEREVVEDYLSFILSDIHLQRPLKVVIDAGNGAAGGLSVELFTRLGCEVIGINQEKDGNFPSHPPDPTIDENLTQLITEVKQKHANLGIAYDGDADRVVFVDEKGNIIRGDEALILFSREILSNNPGAAIIYEVKCSQALIEDLEKHGARGIMYRTGHSFIKKKIREEKAMLAGEMSGHFFFADRYFGYDDGIYASARMVELLSKTNLTPSEIMADVPRYHSTPEIRIYCSDEIKFKVVEEVSRSFKDKYEVITVDGVRVQFGSEGWGLVRASNTQPALILRFEAKTPEMLKEIKNLILRELQKYPELREELRKIE